MSEDHCLLELVDPRTNQPPMVEDGAVVEMVFTFLDWEGGAFMRCALGDMLEVTTQPCECGFPRVRIKIVGRADDMLIVKGVNVCPEAIKSAILRFHPPGHGPMPHPSKPTRSHGPAPLEDYIGIRYRHGSISNFQARKEDVVSFQGAVADRAAAGMGGCRKHPARVEKSEVY